MKDVILDALEVLEFENSLVLVISKNWKPFLGDPILFEAKIENKELVLSSPLKTARTNSKEVTDEVRYPT
jgi:hypothetical protein